jgi:propionyl-CoA synthetase
MATREDHVQDHIHKRSLEDPEAFWAHQAEYLYWHKKPSRTLNKKKKTLSSGVTHDSWEWFPDGDISTCYNCVDRHVNAGRGDDIAIIFDSPVSGVKDELTYSELLDEVEVLAGALREEGVRKGDVVMIYSMLLCMVLP